MFDGPLILPTPTLLGSILAGFPVVLRATTSLVFLLCLGFASSALGEEVLFVFVDGILHALLQIVIQCFFGPMSFNNRRMRGIEIGIETLLQTIANLSTFRSSRKPLVPAKIMTTCFAVGKGENCGCFKISVKRRPRFSWFCVTLSRSLPNCAKAASSRNCARSSFNVPADLSHRLDLALPPTRLTERPR